MVTDHRRNAAPAASVCPYCGQSTIGTCGLCTYHSVGHTDDWATENRIMCDLIHRGIVMPIPRALDRLEAA